MSSFFFTKPNKIDVILLLCALLCGLVRKNKSPEVRRKLDLSSVVSSLALQTRVTSEVLNVFVYFKPD